MYPCLFSRLEFQALASFSLGWFHPTLDPPTFLSTSVVGFHRQVLVLAIFIFIVSVLSQGHGLNKEYRSRVGF